MKVHHNIHSITRVDFIEIPETDGRLQCCDGGTNGIGLEELLEVKSLRLTA
jgi:hypothetical protein